MFVVTVHFKVRSGHEEGFRAAILDQACNSLRLEPECRQFDVCRKPENGAEVFLYEVYSDAAAFDAHQKTDHFAGFGARVAHMVEKKKVQTWERVGGVGVV